MRRELVFSVGPSAATSASRLSLAEAGLKERADLQEWIKENPEILELRIELFDHPVLNP